ncbi:MAG: 16S rRNA (guanine(966)-N(2))-methyltransferase RsmD [Acidimicrobiales bacterium]
MSGVLRVVGGEARGRRLQVPPGRSSRPTRSLVREAAFDMVASSGGVEGARVADLYAGSGALGIEALSRGAASATFVEADRRAVATIRANLAALGPMAGRGEVVCSDVIVWLRGAALRPDVAFDLVLCDPPYAFGDWARLFGHLAGVAAPGALVVAESGGAVEAPPGWVSARSRSYGASVVSLVKLAGQPRPKSGFSQKGPP